jgi:hypothetical protein
MRLNTHLWLLELITLTKAEGLMSILGLCHLLRRLQPSLAERMKLDHPSILLLKETVVKETKTIQFNLEYIL